MLTFKKPFQRNDKRKLTNQQLIHVIRLDISSELEAIYTYDAHIQTTDDEMVKEAISNKRDELKAHVDKLMLLVRNLDPMKLEWTAFGEAHVKKMLSALGISEPYASLFCIELLLGQ